MKNTITTTDRKLIDLTDNELAEILENNRTFQNIVTEALYDNAYFWVDEIMRYIDKARPSYELDYCGGYINIDSSYYPEFLKGFIEICNTYCYRFCEELKPLAERLYSRIDFYIEAENGYVDISRKKFLMLDSWIESGIETLTAALVDFAKTEFSAVYDENENIDYFINCFIPDNGDDYVITETGEIYETCYRTVK